MPKFRKTFEERTFGEMTQGSVFSGAKSYLYKNTTIHGIIITPRCDIAHKKVPFYHYLPMVRLEDWIETELPQIFICHLKNESLGNLFKVFTDYKISINLLKRYNYGNIKKVIEDFKKEHSTHAKEFDNRIRKTFDTLEDLENLESKKIDIEQLYTKYSKQKRSILKELIENKIPHYYFIEHNDNKEGTYYIIRLKEINKLNPILFEEISNGIDTPLSDILLQNSDIEHNSEGNIIMQLCVMRSPYIENLIQQFTQQFSRIGIDDFCQELKNNILQ